MRIQYVQNLHILLKMAKYMMSNAQNMHNPTIADTTTIRYKMELTRSE